MLEKYDKFLNFEVLSESHVKPDPRGSKAIYDTKSYTKEFNTVYQDEVSKAKKNAVEVMVEKLKDELLNKLISVMDENGRQKILDVGDVIIGNKDGDYYPVIQDSDNEKKVRYTWENNDKSKIFDVGKFLDFFEKYYSNQYLAFQGKSLKGGDNKKFVKHVLRIGVHNGTAQDFLIVECDDKTSYLLSHTQPIKIYDIKLKELDPYGEENWEN